MWWSLLVVSFCFLYVYLFFLVCVDSLKADGSQTPVWVMPVGLGDAGSAVLMLIFAEDFFFFLVVFSDQPWKFHPGNGSIRCLQLLPQLQQRGGFQYSSTQHHQRDTRVRPPDITQSTRLSQAPSLFVISFSWGGSNTLTPSQRDHLLALFTDLP